MVCPGFRSRISAGFPSVPDFPHGNAAPVLYNHEKQHTLAAVPPSPWNMTMTRLYLALAFTAAMLGGCEITAERPDKPHAWAQVPSIIVDPDRVVFFDRNSIALWPESRSILKDVVTMVRALEASRVELHGHTDRTGPADYNLRLSRHRAEAVKSALIELGLTDVELVVIAKGEDAPLVPTDDGIREVQNRRVELHPIGNWFEEMLNEWCSSLPPSELVQNGVRHPACD